MNPGRRMLLLLAALFFAPIAVSFYVYFGHSSLQPSGRVNHGDLIVPIRTLPFVPMPLLGGGATDSQFLRHKWSFIYMSDGRCDERCRNALYDTRQVRIALDRDMIRVQRVYLATGECCDRKFLHAQHPDLIVVPVTNPAQPFVSVLIGKSGSGGVTDAPGHVYVADPLGNLVLSYAAGAPAKGMLDDMKRLLKLSHIG